MKRLTMGTLVVTAVFMLAGGTVVAQHGSMMKGEQGDDEGKSSMHGKMMQGKMMKKMRGQGMGGMMMGGMMKKKVTPTEDGGVVVMQGNKMYKYDENLDKVGEATIEMDKEDMQQRMKKMKKMHEKCMQIWQQEEE